MPNSASGTQFPRKKRAKPGAGSRNANDSGAQKAWPPSDARRSKNLGRRNTEFNVNVSGKGQVMGTGFSGIDADSDSGIGSGFNSYDKTIGIVSASGIVNDFTGIVRDSGNVIGSGFSGRGLGIGNGSDSGEKRRGRLVKAPSR